MILPTIGRRVWYRESGLSSQFCDAGICFVHNSSLVNLTVSACNGTVLSRLSVPLFQGPAEECPERSCCWMPYQKAQAEKEAAQR